MMQRLVFEQDCADNNWTLPERFEAWSTSGVPNTEISITQRYENSREESLWDHYQPERHETIHIEGLADWICFNRQWLIDEKRNADFGGATIQDYEEWMQLLMDADFKSMTWDW